MAIPEYITLEKYIRGVGMWGGGSLNHELGFNIL